ncbi:unnamed protein product, partial [Rotaria magnacalcarata]
MYTKIDRNKATSNDWQQQPLRISNVGLIMIVPTIFV